MVGPTSVATETLAWLAFAYDLYNEDERSNDFELQAPSWCPCPCYHLLWGWGDKQDPEETTFSGALRTGSKLAAWETGRWNSPMALDLGSAPLGHPSSLLSSLPRPLSPSQASRLTLSSSHKVSKHHFHPGPIGSHGVARAFHCLQSNCPRCSWPGNRGGRTMRLVLYS